MRTCARRGRVPSLGSERNDKLPDWQIPYRRLALSVLARAVADADVDGFDGETARAFLRAEDPALRFWCELAECDARAIAERARQLWQAA